MSPVIEQLRPLLEVSFSLPAEALVVGEAWRVVELTPSSLAVSRSMTAYLEILGHGLNEPEARQFRDMLSNLHLADGSIATGGDPYRVWEGSVAPILSLTLARALQRVVRASVALDAIRWIVEHADVRRSGEAWVALAYGMDEDRGDITLGQATLTPDDAVLEYLQAGAENMRL
jgi:hypothetical protein